MEKLIRDGVPALAAAVGQHLDFRVCEDRGELAEFLTAKIIEEAAEVASSDPGNLLEELADVLEAVHALAELEGWNRADLERARARKNAIAGPFTKGYVLKTEES